MSRTYPLLGEGIVSGCLRLCAPEPGLVETIPWSRILPAPSCRHVSTAQHVNDTLFQNLLPELVNSAGVIGSPICPTADPPLMDGQEKSVCP
jgi:hypothetical protein